MPQGGTAGIAPTDTAMLNELAQAKLSAGINSSIAQADIQRAEAMSASRAYKMLRMSASLANLTAPTMSVDQACGSAGAKRGSMWQQFHSRLVPDVYAVDSVTRCVDNGQKCGWLNNLNQQGQICTTQCQQDPNHVNYFCGPATVAESSTTEGVGVGQYQAASDTTFTQ